jgi:hypothetical protein
MVGSLAGGCGVRWPASLAIHPAYSKCACEPLFAMCAWGKWCQGLRGRDSGGFFPNPEGGKGGGARQKLHVAGLDGRQPCSPSHLPTPTAPPPLVAFRTLVKPVVLGCLSAWSKPLWRRLCVVAPRFGAGLPLCEWGRPPALRRPTHFRPRACGRVAWLNHHRC